MAKKKSKKANKKAEAAKVKGKAVVAQPEKAKDTGALRRLQPIARDINARLVKIKKYSAQARDHKLSASLQIEAAQKICKENNIGWEKWAKANLDWGLSSIYDMLAIAKSDDPPKAIADSRAKHAKEQVGVRARAKAARTPARAGGDDDAKAPKKTDFQIANEYLAGLDDKTQLAVAEYRAGKLGMVVIPADELKTLRAGTKANGAKGTGVVVGVTPQEVLTAFLALKDVDKKMFVKKAADHIGFTVPSTFDEDKSNLGGIPPSMRRTAPSNWHKAEAA